MRYVSGWVAWGLAEHERPDRGHVVDCWSVQSTITHPRSRCLLDGLLERGGWGETYVAQMTDVACQLQLHRSDECLGRLVVV